MSFNTRNKLLIRNEWNKPLLKFLNKKLNKKLLYLGLPSPEAQDIENWIEFIDEVIAFQCRKYPEPSHEDQNRDKIKKLEEKLNAYERRGLLDTFTVYDGYIEEVILRGVDNNNKNFIQNNTIKIYNLDFCNSITSPIEFDDIDGNFKTAYKFDAVKCLLKIQSELDRDNQYFVLFLTIHTSFNGKELKNFRVSHKASISEYNSLPIPKTEKKAKILRLFVISELKDYYKANNFVAHFLPTIHYKGIKDANLLHFTVMGSKENSGAGSVAFFQDVSNLCKNGFIDTGNLTDPVDDFSKSNTFLKFWENN